MQRYRGPVIIRISMLFIFLSVSIPSVAQQFSSPADYPVGTTPMAVVVGDFNGDGKLDLAVANVGSNNVSILQGNGDGTFQTAVNYNVGDSPKFIATGDIDADGHTDLVVAADSGVIIFLGVGDGTFRSPLQFTAGIDLPEYIALADFNGDKRLDVLVANRSGGTAVLIGNGDGTLQPALVTPTGGATPFVAVGDFNGDGFPDMATGNGTYQNERTPGNLIVLVGNGDGTFQPSRTFSLPFWPEFFTVGDFNHDGKMDLAVAVRENIFGGDVRILAGKGDGSFESSPALKGTFCTWLTVTDLNSDGKLDLIGLEHADPQNLPIEIQLMIENADGTFQSSSFNPCAQSSGCIQLFKLPSWLAVGDFNGDKRPDFVVSNRIANSVSILLNAAQGNSFTVSAAHTGSGKGTVTSNPSGIDCGQVCSTNFPTGTIVTLTATPASDSAFTGWSGACSGATTCVVTLNGNESVTANFDANPQPDFSLSLASSSLIARQGGRVTDVLSLAPVNPPFGNVIQLTCSVSGPAPLAQCALSDSMMSPGSKSVTTTLTITLPSLAAGRIPASEGWRSGSTYAALVALPGLSLIALSVIPRKSKGRARHLWLLSLLLAAIIPWQLGCGGGTGTTSNQSQVYVVTVTGTSGSLQHSTDVMVTLQ